MGSPFILKGGLTPAGDQPQAIQKITEQLKAGREFNSLLGVTGSGKTYSMANIIRNMRMPALVMSHNKTLAAQLYQEFKTFFPENAVEYFVSYYDYYQPESYIPHTDTYIEKDASINDRLDRLRLSATSRLLSRKDCVIVSSVSCIYNIGDPVDYEEKVVHLALGESFERDVLLEKLVSMKYGRNDIDFKRGTFRVRGDVVEIIPAYEETGIRIEFDGETVEKLTQLEVVSGKKLKTIENIDIYPASHFVTSEERIQRALLTIEEELTERIAFFKAEGKLVEAQRIETRTHFDMEMLTEAGYCPGVENYSRHLSGRPPGSRPYSLIDYFPRPFLLIIDESHVTVPQIRGMYHGDHSRKTTLVDHGFRLPSALDNRPLKFEEFEERIGQTLFVSATLGPYELEHAPEPVEQVIRPTGLLDPEIEVRKTEGQIDHLIGEVKARAKRHERVLVTTLTKRLSEELCRYLEEYNVRVKYLHSEIDTIERVEILRALRKREFDCLIGINLLREGLDLPEVSLVAILDADKEGFLRSEVALIQTSGRAARNVNGHVIFYADQMTRSMRKAIKETERRRRIQSEFNKTHHITPRTIQKAVQDGLAEAKEASELVRRVVDDDLDRSDIILAETEVEAEMYEAAKRLEFEKAARLRDELKSLRKEKLHGSRRKKIR